MYFDNWDIYLFLNIKYSYSADYPDQMATVTVTNKPASINHCVSAALILLAAAAAEAYSGPFVVP